MNVLVELKSGETYNGTLEMCDRFMNLKLLEVTETTKDGQNFYKIPELFIKGNSIKSMRMTPSVLEKAREEGPSKTVKSYNKSAGERRDKYGERGQGRGQRGQSGGQRGGKKVGTRGGF